MIRGRITLIFLVSYLAVESLQAQKFLSKEWFAANKEKRALKEKEGRLLITPLAGPAYTPELKLTIAGGS